MSQHRVRFEGGLTFKDPLASQRAMGLLTRALNEGPATIDLAGLTSFDSLAIALLLGLKRQHPHPLTWVNVPEALRDLAQLQGLGLLFCDLESCGALAADVGGKTSNV